MLNLQKTNTPLELEELGSAHSKLMAKRRKNKPFSTPKSLNTFPDSILTEILLRIPGKSLQISKCVCKLWNFLISEESFLKSFTQRSKSLITGFFFTDYVTNNINFFAFHNAIDFINKIADKKLGFIGKESLKVLDSHCGILLVSEDFLYYKTMYVVCNPFNKQFVNLPGIHYSSSYVFIVCREKVKLDDSGIEYNVVCFSRGGDNVMALNIYCSETNEWKASTIVHNMGSFNVCRHYISSDGSIFLWDDFRRRLCVYDLKEETISVVELPTRLNSHRTLMGVSGGSLYYAEVDSLCFTVWGFEIGVGWYLKHSSGYKDLFTEFVEPLGSGYIFCPFAFHPRDPNLVFLRLQCASDIRMDILLFRMDTGKVEVIDGFYPHLDKVVPYWLPASVPCPGNTIEHSV